MTTFKAVIYDYMIHKLGGGQKVACFIASILAEQNDVYLVVEDNTLIPFLEKSYSVDLSRVKTVSLSKVSSIGDIDLFFNAEHAYWVSPPKRSIRKLMYCQFPLPLTRPSALNEYEKIFANSTFSQKWIKKMWNRDSEILELFHNIPESSSKIEKEDIILSVSRIDVNKQQTTMAKIFLESDLKDKYKFVIIGDSSWSAPYVSGLRSIVERSQGSIQLLLDLPFSEVVNWYRRAKVFWHIEGLGVSEARSPSLFQHFGLVTAEAMASGAVPVVFKGGGHLDIITDGEDGFLIETPDELVQKTKRLLEDDSLRERIQLKALERSRHYNLSAFRERLYNALQS